jgi:hypothetical protein
MYTKTNNQTVITKGIPGFSSEKTGEQISDPTLEKEAISDQTSTKWARYQDILTDSD